MNWIIDRGTEFLVEFAEITLKDFGATKIIITARRLQANSIIEHIHQPIRHMIQSLELNR